MPKKDRLQWTFFDAIGSDNDASTIAEKEEPRSEQESKQSKETIAEAIIKGSEEVSQ